MFGFSSEISRKSRAMTPRALWATSSQDHTGRWNRHRGDKKPLQSCRRGHAAAQGDLHPPRPRGQMFACAHAQEAPLGSPPRGGQPPCPACRVFRTVHGTLQGSEKLPRESSSGTGPNRVRRGCPQVPGPPRPPARAYHLSGALVHLQNQTELCLD